MKVIVTVTGTETITKKVGGNLFIGVSYETSQVRARGFKAPRNIHVDNKINCRKSFVVDVGIYACFLEQKRRFLSGDSISCSENSIASLDMSAGVKSSWVVEASLRGDLVKKREWKIEIVAPPDK